MSTEPLLRLFVAVDLPEPVRGEIESVQEGLKGRGLSSLRWVRPEGVHLTLKFLGESPTSKVTAISEALTAATRVHGRFTLHLGGAGSFGGRRGPRVVWIDVGGDLERLTRLQAAVEAALVEVGFSAEKRSYSPHLTLARVQQPLGRGVAKRLAEALETLKVSRLEFEVKEVLLMRSRLLPGGAVYDRLAGFPLS